MKPTCAFFLAAALLMPSIASAQRINHAGRILGPVPAPLTGPVLFDTPAADAIMSALQIMPTTNAFNEDVSGLPLDPMSGAIMMQIESDLAAGRRTLIAFHEMNYVLVPDSQPVMSMLMTNYPDESDDTNLATGIASFAFPGNLPLETWPSETGATTLTAWQTMCSGDCHSITLMPALGRFWETWQTQHTTNTPAWEASNVARFDITSNTLRPDGWTSGDAAGLPMLPALVRYDECQRGLVEHAVRLVVHTSRGAHIYPATHHAGTAAAPRPVMGQRIRLRGSFAIPGTWSVCERAVARALQTYGGIVADNGGFFSFSVTPDERFAAGEFSHLTSIPIASAFEVVQATGATGGPRSPGAPTVDAGPDRTTNVGASLSLTGTATGTGITTTWYLYPYATAPGTVMFGTPMALTTTATFSAVGDYIVMLRATDHVHAVAYDALTVHVAAAGTDAGPIVDAGTDAAVLVDAGTDAATPGTDAGPPSDSGVDAATSRTDASATRDTGARADGASNADAGSAPAPASCACGIASHSTSSGALVSLLALGALFSRRRATTSGARTSARFR